MKRKNSSRAIVHKMDVTIMSRKRRNYSVKEKEYFETAFNQWDSHIGTV
ncbi:MAG: hypothetical protein K8R40_07485 [Anaerolineaceae bacterium]|nr:hypothetical protein [Anaerolineaceae bacterium]